MKNIQIILILILSSINIVQSQNIPNGEDGTFTFNGINYEFYRANGLTIYNSQNIIANGSSERPNHTFYNISGNCHDKRAYTDTLLIVQAIKNVFSPARRQQLINEYIYLECLLHRPTHKIKEIKFVFRENTQITQQEMYQLETIIKSQNHIQNPSDLWCPNLEYYHTDDEPIRFKNIL